MILPAGSEKLADIRKTIAGQVQQQVENLSVSEFKELADALDSITRILAEI